MTSLVLRRIGSAALAAMALAIAPAHAAQTCAPQGEWTIPGGGRVAAQEILARAARAQVVLLGESHDSAEHHLWQLTTMAGLAALRPAAPGPSVVLGFEMFPRRVQGALDRWVTGSLEPQAFIRESEWQQVWGFATELYLPMFHYARQNRFPMVALNVERQLVRQIGAKGLDAVPIEHREGVTFAAAPPEAYVERLFEAFAGHADAGQTRARTDPAFRAFVDAQVFWDRAMAEALAQAAARHPGALVIGVMGREHISYGYGVPHQLRSLGINDVVTLMPVDPDQDCQQFAAGFATAAFGVPAAPVAPTRPLLGIAIDTVPEGVKISSVSKGSLAEAAGLRAGDVLTEVAGRAVRLPGDVRTLVGAMAPGTWLPIKARREGVVLEFVAKFPAATK